MENEQTPAQSENPVPAAPAPENDGFQKRIDQLTAKIHERDAQIMEFQQKMLEQAMKANTPAAPVVAEVDPLAQFNGQLDDTVSRAVKAATEAVERRLKAQMDAQAAAYAGEMAALQVHQSAAASGVEIPPEVRTKAAQVAKQYGASPDVALKLAYGEWHMEQAKRVSAVKGYTPPNTPVLTNSAPPPAPKAGAPGSRPANFESLSLIQQAQWLDQNGFDDSPIG
jgi:hypothetical protein